MPLGGPGRARRRGPWASARRGAYEIAGLARPVCRGWRWLPTAVAVGTLPFLLSFALNVPGHQLVAALALTLVCLACAREDAWIKGVGAIATAYVAHCVLVIAVSYASPERAAPLLPDARGYWQKQIAWIETGTDPEYELSAWVPAHLQLLGAVVVLGFTSLGTITFYQGFYEVDLMNLYNAQLLGASINQPLALVLGWHVWSVLRGLGYLFIAFEVISLGLQCFSGVRVSGWVTRRRRWLLGLSLLVADGLVKAAMLGPVRDQMFANLR